MSNGLVSKLRPWVTTFSEAIRYQCQHKDELKVGGRIVRIFNLSAITGDETDMAYLTIDDDVGQMCLMIPGGVYEQLNKKYSFSEGMIVLADGKLLDPDGALKKPANNKLLKSKNVELPLVTTLVCWNVEPYKEDAVPKQ